MFPTYDQMFFTHLQLCLLMWFPWSVCLKSFQVVSCKLYASLHTAGTLLYLQLLFITVCLIYCYDRCVVSAIYGLPVMEGFLQSLTKFVACKTEKYFCPLIVFTSRNFHHSCIISCFYRDSSWARHLFALPELFNIHVSYVFDNQSEFVMRYCGSLSCCLYFWIIVILEFNVARRDNVKFPFIILLHIWKKRRVLDRCSRILVSSFREVVCSVPSEEAWCACSVLVNRVKRGL